MKSLLLPLLAAIALPTAVNAFSFRGDYVLKTDVGEKYIIKAKTIQIEEDNTKDSLLELINKNFEYEQKPIKQILEDIEYKWTNSDKLVEECRNNQSAFSLGINNLSKGDLCEKKYGDFIKWNQTKYEKGEELKKLNKRYEPYKKMIVNENETSIYKIFKFTPIYQDLNNKKSVMKTEYVSCTNPKINLKTFDYISNDLEFFKNQFLKTEIYEDIKSRICKKYAKF